ncbi:MAG TPA: PKD domain-containing protein [Bacteroidales bacterium]|nr:PKD domain-containing protein [Bacteroidales bacterium]
MGKYFILTVVMIFTLMLQSCGDKTHAPSAVISAQINANTVKFSAEVTDGDQYEWDFGDGSEPSSLADPEHVYLKFGVEYVVTLKITGPGGVSEFRYTVTIPPANQMQSLTGGDGRITGKKWRLKDGEPIKIVKPDISFSVISEWSASSVASAGFIGITQNEFQFFNNGNYTITLTTNGIPAGLQYCLSKGLQNTVPSAAAAEKGLTLATSSTILSNLTYGLNESKDLTVSTTDGTHLDLVTFTDVTTITFSRGGFMGFLDWNTECLVTRISESEMSIVLFMSDIPSGTPMTGKINKAFLLQFIAVN